MAGAGSAPFIVELSIDEFEDFLEGVHPGIGQHKVFHVEDDVAQGKPLFDKAVLGSQALDVPTFGQQIGKSLVGAGNVRQALIEVRLFAV